MCLFIKENLCVESFLFFIQHKKGSDIQLYPLTSSHDGIIHILYWSLDILHLTCLFMHYNILISLAQLLWSLLSPGESLNYCSTWNKLFFFLNLWWNLTHPQETAKKRDQRLNLRLLPNSLFQWLMARKKNLWKLKSTVKGIMSNSAMGHYCDNDCKLTQKDNTKNCRCFYFLLVHLLTLKKIENSYYLYNILGTFSAIWWGEIIMCLFNRIWKHLMSIELSQASPIS